jgi:hypothetical protein
MSFGLKSGALAAGRRGNAVGSHDRGRLTASTNFILIDRILCATTSLPSAPRTRNR